MLKRMLGLLFFITSILGGWGLSALLPLHLRRIERASVAVVLGLVVSAWLHFLVSLLLGFSAAWLITIGAQLVVFALPWLWSWWSRVAIEDESYGRTVSIRRFNRVVALLAGAGLLYLCSVGYLLATAEGWMSQGFVWGDLGIHLSYMSWFGFRDNIQLSLPVLDGAPLAYPFLPDYFGGMMLKGGLSFRWALLLPNAAIVLALAQLLFALGYRITRSVRVAWLQWWLLLASGSVAGLFAWVRVLGSEGLSALDTYAQPLLSDITNDSYVNFLTTHLLIQRGFLFGFATVLVIILVLLKLNSRVDERSVIAVGVLIGLLPFIHVHSFLVVGLVVALLYLVTAITEGKVLNHWLLVGAVGLVVAAPQLAWQMSGSLGEGWVHRLPSGWVVKDWVYVAEENVVWFWLRMIGPLLLVPVLGWWWLLRTKASRVAWALYLMAVGVFIVANLYSFQPNSWDNLKVLFYAIWIFGLVFSIPLAKWSRSRGGAIAVGLIVFLVTGLGAAGFVYTSGLRWVLFAPGDVALARYIREEVPQDALILTTSEHNHPVSALTGRQVVLGHHNWLWTYGLDARQTIADVDWALKGGRQGEEVVRRLGVNYIVLSHNPSFTDPDANLLYYVSRYETVYRQDGWYVLRVTNPIQ